MENLLGIPNNRINAMVGKSIYQMDFLARFTPKNHPSVKGMYMKESDVLVEISLDKKLNEESIHAVYEMIDKIKLRTEISPKTEIENINGINYPVTYLKDGMVIVDYPTII
jgi:hypothetical protein